ncbi:hypothetical protein PDQ74_28960 [Bacillus cereus group sp. Bc005]|nr:MULTISPECIES: hypothetical protein [unclassified Bacillus cereus group]MDA2760921.1 hypothetical protein [Bacillus cereus group sp. Bc007]MDA2766584.1 hypothetical protein [Bacillus cereus group sp. Bc008]MDA2777716.1 hypothetical protein [Bacillus cereus group sp. Bc005]
MIETPISLEDVEVILREIIEKAHSGDEQAMNKLDKIKEWLKNN